MNAPALIARLAHATTVHLPIAAPRSVAGSPAARPLPAREPMRRNRYAKRGFGLGYGNSDGYARVRTFLTTPRLSRYR